MLATYYFRVNVKRLVIVYAIVELIAYLFRSEVYYFFSLPFIYLLYNGKRGPNNRFTKYFFYVFYPANLWRVALINYVLNYINT